MSFRFVIWFSISNDNTMFVVIMRSNSQIDIHLDLVDTRLFSRIRHNSDSITRKTIYSCFQQNSSNIQTFSFGDFQSCHNVWVENISVSKLIKFCLNFQTEGRAPAIWNRGQVSKVLRTFNLWVLHPFFISFSKLSKILVSNQKVCLQFNKEIHSG